jgi:uncharacterized membrane protein YdjX (TVP38/TMEM64 family)
MEIFQTLDSLQNFLLQFGIWTPLVFFLLQLLQIIIAPIPGGTIGLVGGVLFGTIGGFLLSAAGTILGSILVFLLSKRFGRPFVLKFVNPETIGKYDHIKESKLNVILFLIFLFPLFPDDMLCFIAGLSAMPLKTFGMIVLLARTPSVFINNMIGAGIMGMVEVLTSAYISSTLRDAIAFLVLLIVLLIKPAGLLGKNTIEKV